MHDDNYEDHPIHLVLDLINENIIPQNSLLSFSKHIYSYKTKFEKRELIQKKASDLSIDWLSDEINQLQPEWELTFHSNISLVNSKTKFLPLIDFNIEYLNEEIIDIITDRFFKQNKLDGFKDILLNLEVYKSGNSFHGYGKKIVSKEKWFNFTIGILLLNYTKDNLATNTIVDTRWIAHRVLSGYTCLRWSNNSTGKRKSPAYYRTGIIKNTSPNKV